MTATHWEALVERAIERKVSDILDFMRCQSLTMDAAIARAFENSTFGPATRNEVVNRVQALVSKHRISTARELGCADPIHC
jgi:hypothetical protein